MSHRFHVVALDYDGTLTDTPHPPATSLAALRALRARGIVVVLVTGRILDELRADFPEVDEVVDAIVAENGAVLAHDGRRRSLAAPVDPRLARALGARGMPVRSGAVILATKREAAPLAVEIAGALGLDAQVVANRTELMVLPGGISKGTGLRALLSELGRSPHATLGIGDAENDHTLLETCEVGVAVGNAVAALREHADLVLAAAGPGGLADFLAGPVARGAVDVEPSRWRAVLGATPDGRPFSVPASGRSVLVSGGSGSGKSHAAGLFAERLLALDYGLCVLDPEGDYEPLSKVPGVILLGGGGAVPSPEALVTLLHHRSSSVVVDLSAFGWAERAPYLAAAIERVVSERAATGTPQWIFVDEAHVPFGAGTSTPADDGLCLVTYRPWDLRRDVVDACGTFLFLRGACDLGPPVLPERFADQGLRERVEAMVRSLAFGEAVVVTGDDGPVRVTVQRREMPHVRHLHKYLHGYLPPRQHFYFRDDRGFLGHAAANVDDFRRELRRVPPASLVHHLRGRDFSRWLREVVHEDELASAFATFEGPAWTNDAEDLEAVRARLVALVDERYAAMPVVAERCASPT